MKGFRITRDRSPATKEKGNYILNYRWQALVEGSVEALKAEVERLKMEIA